MVTSPRRGPVSGVEAGNAISTIVPAASPARTSKLAAAPYSCASRERVLLSPVPASPLEVETARQPDAVVGDPDTQPAAAAGADLTWHAPGRGAAPCRSAFSTSGCSRNVGTATRRSRRRSSYRTCSRSAKRARCRST